MGSLVSLLSAGIVGSGVAKGGSSWLGGNVSSQFKCSSNLYVQALALFDHSRRQNKQQTVEIAISPFTSS